MNAIFQPIVDALTAVRIALEVKPLSIEVVLAKVVQAQDSVAWTANSYARLAKRLSELEAMVRGAEGQRDNPECGEL